MSQWCIRKNKNSYYQYYKIYHRNKLQYFIIDNYIKGAYDRATNIQCKDCKEKVPEFILLQLRLLEIG